MIAAHAEPHKYDAPVAEGDAVLHDKVQIVRFPAVVERKRVVHFAGATPEIPGHHIPSSAVERFGHAEHVPARAVSFEPMRQDGHTPGTDARAGGDMIYVDEVAVRGFKAFAPERRQGRIAEQHRPDGL